VRKIGISEGRDRIAAGHTNSTVDLYATNGVSGQAKVHFLFSRRSSRAVPIDGLPVCTEMWPRDIVGEQPDPGGRTLAQALWRIRVCVVVDRGMISAETIAVLSSPRLTRSRQPTPNVVPRRFSSADSCLRSSA
jgi:hypothetical protein